MRNNFLLWICNSRMSSSKGMVSNSYWGMCGIRISMNSFRRSIAIISSISPTVVRNVLILVISLHRVHHTDVGVVYGDHHVS